MSNSFEFNGIITKAVGGVYYSDALDGHIKGENIRCAARGIFRNRKISPAAGDRVRVSVCDNAEPVIEEIFERKNYLPRPPLANLDGIVFVNSTAEPKINRFVLDKLIAIADGNGVEPIVVFTKIDLNSAGEFPRIYEKIGIPVRSVNNLTGEGAEKLRELIEGKFCAFVGNSGVGKSSLLNALYPELSLQTAEISKKLGRGRHTTRQVELFKIGENYVADTPGFSAVDIENYCDIPREELDLAFREFREPRCKCRFTNCLHIKETGCAVKKAVEDGEIAESRYNSYLRLIEEKKPEY
ncbi:MAG TPA: ribosome small subunit-dependent GTPase A [Ruminococcaceae bacterium]|nr:ribosome small subunit-dependent GTPase A [Oscillospiraceae bacterium]